MSEIKSSILSATEYTQKSLQNIKKEISKLDKTEQLEILKIIKRNNDRLTENKNGVFINLSNISVECLETIDKFVKYSIDNKERLNNLEKMSETLFRESMLRKQYDKYNIKSDSQNKNEKNLVNNSNIRKSVNKEYSTPVNNIYNGKSNTDVNIKVEVEVEVDDDDEPDDEPDDDSILENEFPIDMKEYDIIGIICT